MLIALVTTVLSYQVHDGESPTVIAEESWRQDFSKGEYFPADRNQKIVGLRKMRGKYSRGYDINKQMFKLDSAQLVRLEQVSSDVNPHLLALDKLLLEILVGIDITEASDLSGVPKPALLTENGMVYESQTIAPGVIQSAAFKLTTGYPVGTLVPLPAFAKPSQESLVDIDLVETTHRSRFLPEGRYQLSLMYQLTRDDIEEVLRDSSISYDSPDMQQPWAVHREHYIMTIDMENPGNRTGSSRLSN